MAATRHARTGIDLKALQSYFDRKSLSAGVGKAPVANSLRGFRGRKSGRIEACSWPAARGTWRHRERMLALSGGAVTGVPRDPLLRDKPPGGRMRNNHSYCRRTEWRKTNGWGATHLRNRHHKPMSAFILIEAAQGMS